MTEPATTAAATNTKRKITEEMSMDSDFMLKAGKILSKNGWIGAEDTEVLVLICDEAKEALLRKEQQRKKREASHHAQQLISAKDDLSKQQLEKEKAVLQAAHDQLLRRLNSRQKQHNKLEQPTDRNSISSGTAGLWLCMWRQNLLTKWSLETAGTVLHVIAMP